MRERPVKIFLLSAALLLLVPASAAADRLDRANRLAVEMWGPALTEVCPDGLTVRWERASDPGLFGWTWQNKCEIGLNTSQPILRRWAPYCDTFLHEAGHILGYDHDHTGHGRIMSSHAPIVRDVFLIGKLRDVEWSGVHPSCFPAARANMASGVGVVQR
jgi:hypothetical protein